MVQGSKSPVDFLRSVVVIDEQPEDPEVAGLISTKGASAEVVRVPAMPDRKSQKHPRRV